MRELLIRRLSTGTIYRLFFVGLMCGAIPIFAFLGVLGYFDLATLNWNNKPLTGVSAILGGPFIGLLFALVITALGGSAAAFGLWIYSKFRALEIRYEEEATGYDDA